MTRFTDGPPLTLSDLQQSITGSVAAAPAVALSGYRFLFPDLQANPKNRLPETNQTANRLIDLGLTMVDPDPSSEEGNSQIPSAYTYFGQFIDHDLTRQMKIPGDELKPGMQPLLSSEIPTLTNARSPLFDLDCVYGPPTEPNTVPYGIPQQGEKLVIEAAQDGPPFTDLPRERIPKHDAFIGDRRNDENLIISQMHVAFLRAHNALVDSPEVATFAKAQTALRRIYQYITVNDYLPKIADPIIVKQVVDGQLNVFDPPDGNVRIPLEFSVAAFRTAHSMIRNVYNYNEKVPKARLFQLFQPGPLREFKHIIAAWIIDWTRFFDGPNTARLFRPTLAPDLSLLGPPTFFDLATIDLLRGYLCRLPTGEAVARRLGVTPMSFAEISAVTTTQQQQALIAGEFENRTPLWFYLLCEAAATKTGRLGRVGSIIVASVVVSLVRKSKDSYMQIPNWTPFDKGEGFGLADLFRFAGVLPTA